MDIPTVNMIFSFSSFTREIIKQLETLFVSVYPVIMNDWKNLKMLIGV